MLSRVVARRVPPPPQPSVVGGVVHWLVSVCCVRVGVGGHDRPAEAGQVAGDCRGDDRFAFAALVVEAAPEVMQPLLRSPCDRDHGGGLVLLAVLERWPEPRWAAVVPGGLDQQPAGVLGAGLGDRSLAAGLA